MINTIYNIVDHTNRVSVRVEGGGAGFLRASFCVSAVVNAGALFVWLKTLLFGGGHGATNVHFGSNKCVPATHIEKTGNIRVRNSFEPTRTHYPDTLIPDLLYCIWY